MKVSVITVCFNANAVIAACLESVANQTYVNPPQTFWHEAQTGLLQSLFQAATGSHDTAINLGNHDSVAAANDPLADLHVAHFISHPPLIG